LAVGLLAERSRRLFPGEHRTFFAPGAGFLAPEQRKKHKCVRKHSRRRKKMGAKPSSAFGCA
jgi:hypothetical protein